MTYLKLYNPTKDTCYFRVRLSNAFNTKYYKKVRITGTNYGSSTSRVGSYVESRTAKKSTTSKIVSGIVDNGLSARKTYRLYAYAQAQNGTWYKAGTDTITMLSGNTDSEKKEDLRIKSIKAPSALKVGKEATFRVTVRNYGKATSDDYVVRVYDEDGNKLDYNKEKSLRAGRTRTASVDVKIDIAGSHKLKFVVDGDSDDSEYKTYKWENAITSSGADQLESHIEEYTNFKCDGVKVKIPYYMTPEGTTKYGGKKTPEEIRGYLRKHASSTSEYQTVANANKRYCGVDCSGLVAYVLNETTGGRVLDHWGVSYANGISGRNLTTGERRETAADIEAGCTMRTARGNHVIVIYDVIKENGIVTKIKYAHSNGSKGPHKGYIDIGDENQDLDGDMQTWHDIAYTDATAKRYYDYTVMISCVDGYIC